MNIDQFVSKYNIALDPEIYAACFDGIEVMGKSIDPHHNNSHVDNLLNYLDILLISNPAVGKTIDYNILLPAICWHDVWVSQRQAKSPMELVIHQIAEGRGSANMWNKYAQGKMSSDYVNRIRYCIRKHSSLQLLPTFTIEAKILIDLDKLDLWNIARFLGKDKHLASQKKLYSRYIVQAYYQYSWYAGLYFAELNNQLDLLRNMFWAEIR
jgi:hypothetical protein